jgi:hypothetical protein
MKKNQIGITRSGIKENCNWEGPGGCPRHAHHDSQKLSPLNVDSLNLISDNNDNNFYNYLSEQESKNLSRFGFIEKDNKYLRLMAGSNGKLEEFRLFNSLDEFDDEQLTELNENGLIIVDNVGYEIDEYGELTTHMPNHNPAYINLETMVLENGLTVPEYIEAYKGTVLLKELEDLYMNGGCAVYALSLKELYPDLQIAVDTWGFNDDPDLIYNHVFCLNLQTGEAYDARGRFSSPEELMDYKKDDPSAYHLSEEDGTYVDEGYQIWSYEKAKLMSLAGNFNFDYNQKDVEYTKKIIEAFAKRNR